MELFNVYVLRSGIWHRICKNRQSRHLTISFPEAHLKEGNRFTQHISVKAEAEKLEKSRH